MIETQSNYQDLTLDFIGDQEVLVIIPKEPTKTGGGIKDLNAINPKSAIIAKKITSRGESSEENLDSNAYAISFELANNETPETPFSTKIIKALEKTSANYPKSQPLISKDYLLKTFHICGILNVDKLKNSTPETNNFLELGAFIELFPETKKELLDWVGVQ